MTVRRHVRMVEAVLESPFLSQGLWAHAPGLDSALARDHHGRLIIPGSQLRGVLRQIMQGMLDQKNKKYFQRNLDDWFGKGSGNFLDEPGELAGIENPFWPRPGMVGFRDLVCQQEPTNQGAMATRIALDPNTGSVAKGALQVMEMPFPYGAEVPFLGEVVFYGEDAEAAQFWEAAGLALCFVSALGGVKSAGFGNLAREMRLLPSHPEPTKLIDFSAPPSARHPERMALELELHDPFLVDAELIGENIFQGNWIIPGAVIKGSLARALELYGMSEDMKEALSQVLFSHAFPVKTGTGEGVRPRRIPFSAIECGGRLYDCFWQDDKKLLGKMEQAIAYPVDWKSPSWRTAGRIMGWPSPPDYHVRTRTAINSAREVAEEGRLFSYRAVVPEGLRWRLVLDKGTADDVLYSKIVQAILSGLHFLGKTEARASCREVWDPIIETLPKPREVGGGELLWRVILQTPALMFATARCVKPVTQDPPEAMELYQDYWQHVISIFEWPGDAPRLAHFDFRAAQKWEGGYRARRYRQQDGFFTPYLLTQPGSVFVMRLEGVESVEQKEFFTQLLRRGLPLYGSLSLCEPGRWKDSPYPPENGYGEVKVDWVDAENLAGGVCVA